MKKLLVTLALSLFSISSIADSGLYGGVGFSSISLDGTDVDFDAYIFILGYKVNSMLSIEGRYIDVPNAEPGDGVQLDLDDVYSAYVMVTLPMSDKVNPYFMAGATHARATVAEYSYYDESVEISDSYTASSYGMGLKYDISSTFTVRAEFSQLIDDVSQTGIYVTGKF